MATEVERVRRPMRATLIYNPVAGPRDVEADLVKAIALLEAQGWQVTLRRTLGRGDATTFARQASTEDDVAIVAGGDGTIGEVATGLVGSRCVMGVLPVGTGNIWAHMVGLPVWTPSSREALLEATQILLTGQIHRIDLGHVGERYFVLWSGIGFDAQVARSVEPHREMRRSLGNFTYLVTALAQAMSMRGVRTTVVVDGRAVRERVILIVVTNIQLYGAKWRFAPQAQLDDGLLEVYVFRGGSAPDVFRHLAMILTGLHQQDPHVERFSARTVEVRGERPLPLHLDGDPAGYTPVTISVAPKALSVLVPEWTSKTLFAGEDEADATSLSLAQRIARYWEQQRDYWREEGQRLRDDLGRRLRPPSGQDRS